jgi:hypothetical protein
MIFALCASILIDVKVDVNYVPLIFLSTAYLLGITSFVLLFTTNSPIIGLCCSSSTIALAIAASILSKDHHILPFSATIAVVTLFVANVAVSSLQEESKLKIIWVLLVLLIGCIGSLSIFLSTAGNHLHKISGVVTITILTLALIGRERAFYETTHSSPPST